MLLCAFSPCARSVGSWRRSHGFSSAGASCADRVRRHGILPLGEAALSVLLDAQAQRRHDRIFPYAGGRDAGGAGEALTFARLLTTRPATFASAEILSLPRKRRGQTAGPAAH